MRKQPAAFVWTALITSVLMAVACTAPLPDVQPTSVPAGKTAQPATTASVATAQAEAFSPGAPPATAPVATQAPEPKAVSPTPAPENAAAVQTAQAEVAIVGAPAPVPTATAPASQAANEATPAVQSDQAAAQQASMREEVFMAGAPSFALTNRCVLADNLGQGEHAATWTSTVDMGLLCLFGFGENETVQYEIQDAGGEVVEAGQGVQDNLDDDPLPSVKVPIGIGDRPPGTWHVAASGPSGELEDSFEVQPATLDGKPAIVLALGGGLSQFAVGQSAAVGAFGLPASGSPMLGVYDVITKSMISRQLRLHEAAALEPDAGAAFITLTLDPTYAPGEYCLVLQATAAYEPSEELSTEGATRCFEVTK